MEDVLGIKPYGECIKIATEKTLVGVGAFLNALCMPAAQEMGLMIQDNFRHWRLKNVVSILEKSQGKLLLDISSSTLRLHPRIGIELMENGSKEDSDEIQDYWAGLLVSSLSEKGEDDSGLLYLNILKQLTRDQILLINYACENAEIIKMKNGLVVSEEYSKTFSELSQITKIEDIHKIDRVLDHLISLGLINPFSGGFSSSDVNLVANIQPSALAINLYVRCKGSRENPADFFKI